MKDYSATGNYYCIAHLVQFTGLTDRTIRNYISLGILEGEKINGLWHFTPEQVRSFICHPAVRPSIQAKQNGKIFDFLLDKKKSEDQACVILDLPGVDEKVLTEHFCYGITDGEFHNIHFTLDAFSGVPRVILVGDTQEVLRLVNGYYSLK